MVVERQPCLRDDRATEHVDRARRAVARRFVPGRSGRRRSGGGRSMAGTRLLWPASARMLHADCAGGSDAARDVAASRTEIAQHRLSPFVSKRAQRRPRDATRLTGNATLQFRRLVILGASSTSTRKVSTIGLTGDTTIQGNRLRHLALPHEAESAACARCQCSCLSGAGPTERMSPHGRGGNASPGLRGFDMHGAFARHRRF